MEHDECPHVTLLEPPARDVAIMSAAGTFVVNDSGRIDNDDLLYDVRLPWYRSLPLSSVVSLDIEIDRTKINADDIRVLLNGRTLRPKEFAPIWTEYWFVQDRATIRVSGLPPGLASPLTVRTRLSLRSPYIMIAPQTPLVSQVDATTHFLLEEVRSGQ